MNDKVRKRIGTQKLHYNGNYVLLDEIAQKNDIQLLEDQSVLITQSADLTHIFGCGLEQNQTGAMMKRIGPHYPQYSNDIIRKHSLIIYSDIRENIVVGDTKTPLLRCILFISKVKNGDKIPTGQYMNYQSFSNLRFKKILKNFFRSVKIRIRITEQLTFAWNLVGVALEVLTSHDKLKLGNNSLQFYLWCSMLSEINQA